MDQTQCYLPTARGDSCLSPTLGGPIVSPEDLVGVEMIYSKTFGSCGLLLCISCLVAVVGCGDPQADALALPEVDVQSLTTDLRLRTDVEYPVEWEGQSVCAIYDYVDVDGHDYVKTEGYHFDKMNSELSNDDELRDYLSARGLNEVSGCDDARTFTELKYELLESRPSEYVLEDDGVVREGGTKPETLAAESELLVKDSQTFGNPPTVKLTIWNGSSAGMCSGFMISDTAVLTAAHCIPSTGWRPITIEAANGTCAYPASWSDCDVKPSNTAYGYRHANYTGPGDAADDIGLFTLSYEPSSPLNTSTARLRIAVSNTSAGHDVWGLGYGANTNTSGIGTQRLTNSEIEVDWAGYAHFYWTIQSGEGRMCSGDSGGPIVATYLAAHDVAMGINSERTFPTGSEDDFCSPTGYQDRQTMMSKKISWIEDKIGECDTYPGEGWFEYKKCW